MAVTFPVPVAWCGADRAPAPHEGQYLVIELPERKRVG